MANINRVVLVGNLTRDPELRHTPSGTPCCKLRIAVNTRQKDGATASGPTSRTTSTSPSGATRARAARSILAKGRPVGDRRPARLARVGGPGRHEAPGGRDHRRQRAVPRRPRRARGGGGSRSSCRPARAASRRRLRPVRRRRRHPVLGGDDGASEASRDAAQAAPARGRPARRKSCYFCKEKVDEVDYKNYNQLRRYISEKGKIRSRRITGACRRHQNQVAVAVKRAREMALLPYVAG